MTSPPPGLRSGGKKLWKSIEDDYDLDASQLVQLEEACRAKDRLDKLDLILSADIDTWATLTLDVNSDGQVYELRMTQALSQANSTAMLMKQLLAAMRLPDLNSGTRPQRRGGARGAYQVGSPSKPATVSSLDRARKSAQSKSKLEKSK